MAERGRRDQRSVVEGYSDADRTKLMFMICAVIAIVGMWRRALRNVRAMRLGLVMKMAERQGKLKHQRDNRTR